MTEPLTITRITRFGAWRDIARRHEVIRIITKPGASARIFAAAAAAFAAVGLAACAAPGGTPTVTVTKTVTKSAPAGQTAAASGSTDASSGANKSAAGALPEYQPSTVVNKALYSTVLTSPDSVNKIGEFYKKALAAGGWDVTSSSMGRYHASFTAHRSSEGANISVYPRWGGSGISISTHPE